MKFGKVKVGKNFIRLFLSLLLVCLTFSVSSMEVSAAGWVDKTSDVYETLYGSEDDAFTGSGEEIEEGKVGFLEEFVAELLNGVAEDINNLLTGENFDFSIDGIVFGRMAATIKGTGYVKADFTHFGLEKNNPWGIIGATMFYALRNIVLVILPIVLLVLLILELFHNTGKGRARLKELAIHTVYVFGLLFVLPYALDAFIYFRDAMLYGVYLSMRNLIIGISGSSNTGIGIIETMIGAQDGRIVSAAMLLASVFAGVFFLIDYVRIALLLSIAFGIFPLIAVMSFWNNKKLSEWSNVFFPNLLVPFIDMSLVLVPSILNALFVKIFGEDVSIIVSGLITLIVIWNVVAIRNRIVKLLGFDGIGGGTNIGQMLETLSHMRHMGNKPDKGTGKPENEKKEESASASSAPTAPGSSAGSEMSSHVNNVVNSTPPAAESLGSESETDKTLREMEEESSMAGKKSSAADAVVNNEESANVPDPNIVTDPGEKIGDVETQSTTADQGSQAAGAQTVVSLDANTGMEKEQYTENTAKMSNDHVDKVLKEERYAGTKAGLKAAGKVALEGTGNVVSKGIKAAGPVAVKGARVVGAATVGTVSAVAAGYGGMGASIGAGVVGARIGSKVPEAVNEGVDLYGKGKQTAKDAIFSTYRGSVAVHDAYVDAKSQVDPQYAMKKKADQGAADANKKREELEQQRRQDQEELNNKSTMAEL